MIARALIAVALAVAVAGCRHQSTPADAAPEPNRNPYRNVMPDKVKKQVEETERQHEEKIDKLQENAK
jgi:hypothetical protein